MEWNVLFIKPCGLLTGTWVTVLRRGRKHFHHVLCRSSDFSQLIFCCSIPVAALQFSSMCEVLGVKLAHLLSQNHILTSEDWTNVTISTGLGTIPQKGDVTRVQRGAWHKRWCSNVSSVTWCFVWTKVVLLITTQKTNYKTPFRPCSVQTAGALTTM
jgi:hypothetical protein